MSAPTPLRQDFDAPQVRGLARKTKDGPQARRLLALAAIYDGATRTEAAKIGGVGLQIIRDWVLRFNARGPDGLLDGKSTGQPSKLNDTQRQAIAGMIESGPIPAVHGVVRWRLIDLAQWIFEESRITIAKQTLSRELRAMGYRKLSARPRQHAQAEGAIEDFKKTSPRAWRQGLGHVLRLNQLVIPVACIMRDDETCRSTPCSPSHRRWLPGPTEVAQVARWLVLQRAGSTT